MYFVNKGEEIGHFDHGFWTESPRFLYLLKSVLIRFIKLFSLHFKKKKTGLIKVNVFPYI